LKASVAEASYGNGQNKEVHEWICQTGIARNCPTGRATSVVPG
jgi:hypothetical protein